VRISTTAEKIGSMTPDERRRLMTREWRHLHRELVRILYEEDPLKVGSSVGSTTDEYDLEAIELIARLRDNDGDAGAALASLFEPRPSRQLEDRVQRAWEAYEDSR
jgi:hypothetical protein